MLTDQEFHLVFLSGHGVFHDNRLQGAPSESYFILESETGRSDPKPSGAIADALKGNHVRCVVLCACQTGKLASDDLNASLSLRIYQAGVPHVVGMRESVFDAAGILFSRAFCDSVGRGDRVDSVHMRNQEIEKAYAVWGESYGIAKEIGSAQELAALDGIAKQLGRTGMESCDRGFTRQNNGYSSYHKSLYFFGVVLLLLLLLILLLLEVSR